MFNQKSVSQKLVVVFVTLCGFGWCIESAEAQSARFQNAMQATIDVIVTNEADVEVNRFTLGTGNFVSLRSTPGLFRFQIIPRDERNSGFRLENIDLVALGGQLTRLRGEFSNEVFEPYGELTYVGPRSCIGRLVHRRRSGRGTENYVMRLNGATPEGERVAVVLEGTTRDGESIRIRAKKMTY